MFEKILNVLEEAETCALCLTTSEGTQIRHATTSLAEVANVCFTGIRYEDESACKNHFTYS